MSGCDNIVLHNMEMLVVCAVVGIVMLIAYFIIMRIYKDK